MYLCCSTLAVGFAITCSKLHARFYMFFLFLKNGWVLIFLRVISQTYNKKLTIIFQVVKKGDTGKLFAIPFDKIRVNTIKEI